jgi:hypothetical protein
MPSHPPAKASTRLLLSDYLLLAIALVGMVAFAVYLSAGRELGSDELLGLQLVRDPGLSHMLHAWRLGADGGGISSYLTARLWAAAFGASMRSMRLFNALGIYASLLLLWIAARRWYRAGIVAFSLLFLWFSADPVLHQLMVFRFYGVFMASVAALLLLYLRDPEQLYTWPYLAAVFLANSYLIGLHPFGVLYAAALLSARIALDAARKHFRPWLYPSAVAGCWIFLPSITAIRASRAVIQPWFWAQTPSLADLGNTVFFWTDVIMALGLFVLFCLLLRAVRPRLFAVQQSAPDDHAPLFFASALMAVVPLTWLLSLHGTSLFVDRYLLPSLLGAALLLCAALQRLLPAHRSFRHNIALAAIVLALGLATTYDVRHNLAAYPYPPHAYTAALADALPRDAPVVVERMDIFVEALSAHPKLPLYYLLDWPTATDPASPRVEVSAFHEMQNWKRAGYHPESIQDSACFLESTPEFWIITDPSYLWFQRHIQHNPAYSAEPVRELHRDQLTETLWHVKRLPQPAPTSAPPFHPALP